LLFLAAAGEDLQETILHLIVLGVEDFLQDLIAQETPVDSEELNLLEELVALLLEQERLEVLGDIFLEEVVEDPHQADMVEVLPVAAEEEDIMVVVEGEEVVTSFTLPLEAEADLVTIILLGFLFLHLHIQMLQELVLVQILLIQIMVDQHHNMHSQEELFLL
jgi:hypothetical protein